MKAVLILCAFATCAHAAPVVLNRVTAETVTRLQQMTPMVRLNQPEEGKGKVVRPIEQSIVKQSVILHDGNNWTLVPIGAVIFLPEAMKSRVNVRPVGTLLPFIEFLGKNPSWITTNEVSFEQAAGVDPLPAARVAFWATQEKVVIAVHQGGPISVRIVTPSPTLSQR